jgi:sugar (pentulose or hexulose) kinase
VSGELVLGIDVGTSSIKAAAFDTDGRDVAHSREPTPWRMVDTGAELDPGALLASTRKALGAVLAAAGPAPIAAIGVASMAETGVLLDRSGTPVVPSIAWHDGRGAAEAADLAARVGEDAFAARVGIPATAACTLVKYRWMRGNWPAADRGVRWLNLAEWIVLGLGGEPSPELSLASRTGFYDLHARRPWPEALAWADAPSGLVADPVPAGAPMGQAGSELGRAVLTVGGHDHLAGAVGAGATESGDVLDSCGTAEAFVQATLPLQAEAVSSAVRSGLSVGWHAIEGRQAVIGGVMSGSALERVLALLGVDPAQRDGLEAAALEIERRHRGPTLTVAGLGEDALAQIGHDALPAAAYHAVLDAAGAAGAAVLARMAVVAGPARRLLVTGGWAAGDAARAVKQRHLGEVRYLPATFTGAHGAALAAGRAAGLWTSAEDMATAASGKP